MHHKREIGSHSSTMHYSKCVVTGIMCIGRCGQLTVLTYGTGGRDGGLFIISFTSLVEYFYPSGKWKRINESLHYLYIATNQHRDIHGGYLLTGKQCTNIQKLLTRTGKQ